MRAMLFAICLSTASDTAPDTRESRISPACSQVGAYLRETYETFENAERRVQAMQGTWSWSISRWTNKWTRSWTNKLAKRVGLRGRSRAVAEK